MADAAEYGAPGWSGYHTKTWRIRMHVQELAENVPDAPHFRYVHQSLRSIASAGLGLRWSPDPRLRFELYRGAPLRDVEEDDPERLQDLGIHARLRVLSF
jgi:hypothetical protein